MAHAKKCIDDWLQANVILNHLVSCTQILQSQCKEMKYYE